MSGDELGETPDYLVEERVRERLREERELLALALRDAADNYAKTHRPSIKNLARVEGIQLAARIVQKLEVK